MDVSILERRVSSLEKSLDSLESWLAIATTLVVVGLVVEYWHEIPESIQKLKDARKWLWQPVCIILGAILITIGVAGELGVQFFASRKGTDLRDTNHEIGRLLNAKVADLNKEAGDARKEAGAAIERASRADELARGNEKEAATLRKRAEDEAMARVSLEARIAPRSFSRAERQKIGDELRWIVPYLGGRTIVVSSYLGEVESFVFAAEIRNALLRSGIPVESNIGRIVPTGILQMGVNVKSSISDMGLQNILSDTLARHGHAPVSRTASVEFVRVEIFVGPKQASDFDTEILAGLPPR